MIARASDGANNFAPKTIDRRRGRGRPASPASLLSPSDLLLLIGSPKIDRGSAEEVQDEEGTAATAGNEGGRRERENKVEKETGRETGGGRGKGGCRCAVSLHLPTRRLPLFPRHSPDPSHPPPASSAPSSSYSSLLLARGRPGPLALS